MKKVEIKIYEFEELNEKAQEYALNNYRENQEYIFLSGYLEEILKSELTKRNIKSLNEIIQYYDLDYHRGDGYQFNGKYEFTFKNKIYHTTIKQDGDYCNNKCVNISIIKLNNNHDDIEQEVYDYFKEQFEDITEILEKEGYKIIKDVESEENIKEEIKANNYLFYENGIVFQN